MTIRPLIVISGIVAVAVIATVGYFWTTKKNGVDSLVQSPTGSFEGSASQTDLASDEIEVTARAASESAGESLETIMLEIERDASGDDTAMEDELAGESESFMEGAVVMEQLGQSYDETSY